MHSWNRRVMFWAENWHFCSFSSKFSFFQTQTQFHSRLYFNYDSRSYLLFLPTKWVRLCFALPLQPKIGIMFPPTNSKVRRILPLSPKFLKGKPWILKILLLPLVIIFHSLSSFHSLTLFRGGLKKSYSDGGGGKFAPSQICALSNFDQSMVESCKLE